MKKVVFVFALALAIPPLAIAGLFTLRILEQLRVDAEQSRALLGAAVALFAAVLVGLLLVAMARPERTERAPEATGGAGPVLGAGLVSALALGAAGAAISVIARNHASVESGQPIVLVAPIPLVVLIALYPLWLAYGALYRYAHTPARYSVAALRSTIVGVVCVLGGPLLLLVAVEELDGDELAWAGAVATGLFLGGVRSLFAGHARRKAHAEGLPTN